MPGLPFFFTVDNRTWLGCSVPLLSSMYVSANRRFSDGKRNTYAFIKSVACGLRHKLTTHVKMYVRRHVLPTELLCLVVQ